MAEYNATILNECVEQAIENFPYLLMLIIYESSEDNIF